MTITIVHVFRHKKKANDNQQINFDIFPFASMWLKAGTENA